MRKLSRFRLIAALALGFFLISTLASVHSALAADHKKPLSALVFSFFDNCCNGYWFAGAPNTSAELLPCPGSDTDERGFIRPLGANYRLEDDSLAARSIETHPMWKDDGYIEGRFRMWELGSTMQQGDHFMAKVGFLKGAQVGRVSFSLIYDEDPIEPGGEYELARVEDRYDGQLKTIIVDLSRFAGQDGKFTLQVDAIGSSQQDWAVWVNPRIERGVMPTSTFTSVPTLTPTTTPTRTLTATPTAIPTFTATPTLIPTIASPIATRRPRPIPTVLAVETSFWADDYIVNAGKCTSLHWGTRNSKEVWLDWDGDGILDAVVEESGEKEVCPLSTTIYTLHVILPDESTRDKNVTVTVPPRPCGCFESDNFEAKFTPYDCFAAGNIWGGSEAEMVTAVDEDAGGDDGRFYIYDHTGQILTFFDARFTHNDRIAIGNVWGEDELDEIIVAIDEDDRVYFYNYAGEPLFDFQARFTKYDCLAVGDVLDENISQGEEIVIAIDEDDKVYIYSRQGELIKTFDIPWNFNGSWNVGKKRDSNDAMAVGNVFGDERDEIVLLDEQHGNESLIYIYDGNGTLLMTTQVRFTKYDCMTVGDVLGDEREEIIIGIDEDHAINIYDAVQGLLKMRYAKVTPVDALAAANIGGGPKEEILLAIDDDKVVYIFSEE